MPELGFFERVRISAGSLNLAFRGHAELASTEYVSGEYFRGLAARPATGRLIAPGDDRAGAAAVAVIGFDLSQRRFGGAAGASGQSILTNNLFAFSPRCPWLRGEEGPVG